MTRTLPSTVSQPRGEALTVGRISKSVQATYPPQPCMSPLPRTGGFGNPPYGHSLSPCAAHHLWDGFPNPSWSCRRVKEGRLWVMLLADLEVHPTVERSIEDPRWALTV